MQFTINQIGATLLAVAKVMLKHDVCAAEAASNKFDEERTSLMLEEGIPLEQAKAFLEIDLCDMIAFDPLSELRGTAVSEIDLLGDAVEAVEPPASKPGNIREGFRALVRTAILASAKHTLVVALRHVPEYYLHNKGALEATLVHSVKEALNNICARPSLLNHRKLLAVLIENYNFDGE